MTKDEIAIDLVDEAIALDMQFGHIGADAGYRKRFGFMFSQNCNGSDKNRHREKKRQECRAGYKLNSLRAGIGDIYKKRSTPAGWSEWMKVCNYEIGVLYLPIKRHR